MQGKGMRSVAVVLWITSAGACFAYAYWRENFTGWLRESGGGIPYVVFWIMFLFVLFPRPQWAFSFSGIATGITCALEVFQLWKPAWLTEIRESAVGAALLGSGFSWQDFPPYFLGGVIGYLILKAVSRVSASTNVGHRSSSNG